MNTAKFNLEKSSLAATIVLNLAVYLYALWIQASIYFGVYRLYTISGSVALLLGVSAALILFLGLLSAVSFVLRKVRGEKIPKALIGTLVINWFTILLAAALFVDYGRVFGW